MLGLVTLVSVALFYRHPIRLVGILVVIGICIWMVEGKKKEDVLLYALSGIFGVIAEVIAITTGTWQYAAPYMFGVPIWLPFLWGIAGLYMKRLYITAKLISN